MPRYESPVAGGDKIALRLVGPRALVWPTSPAANTQVLQRSDMVSRPLVISQLPDSPDLVSGSYTLRLGDAGEGAFTFPNGPASDGVPYRQKFDPTGHLMWIEVYVDGVLEAVGVLDTVNPTDGRGFSATLDATDFACSLWGNGAGLQNGTTGQLQAVVFDPGTMLNSLFDVQQWQDFSDAAFPRLLQGLLNSQLGLQLTPWQLLSADPTSGGGGGSVDVHMQDGWFLLKKAYERDLTVVKSPRDVIARATQVWVPTTVDNFPAGSLNPQWTHSGAGTSVTIGPSGGALLSANASTSLTMTSTAVTVPATQAWRAIVSLEGPVTPSTLEYLYAGIIESDGTEYDVRLGLGQATLFLFGGLTTVAGTATPTGPEFQLMVESDGEWVWAFANGALVGCVRRQSPTTTSLQVVLRLNNSTGSTQTVTVSGILAEGQRPFLQPGPDEGDYVLPGVASTYPSGGLHARYYNDTDLQGDSNRLQKILAPSRSQAYAGSGTSEYQNQQDATINNQANPMPGASTANWSAKWFGAIYLKLSQGSYGLQLESPTGVAYSSAARVWVGQTAFGTQLVDQWAWQNGNANWPFTVSATTLAGNPGYGGTPVARDGWYPIIIEYAIDTAGGGPGLAPILIFTNVPGSGYTDPGGTTIAGGAQTTVIPATSLSPLGCVDQRYQGIAHFDLAQQTVQAYDYQASVEPQRLESGLFPGVLAPRIREGHDTDILLVPDKTARDDWTGTLKPQLANTWPLPGNIAAMRWRPGDGIRVRDREINVWDTQPRQILTFQRNLLPGGIGSAVANLANRAKNQGRALKRQLYTATRWQRNYQKQLVTLTGGVVNLSIGAGATGVLSLVQTAAADTIKRAYVRISTDTVAVPLNLVVNGTDQTTTLKGPWTILPLNLDITAVAAPDGNGNINVAVKIPGATGSDVQYQLLVDVLR